MPKVFQFLEIRHDDSDKNPDFVRDDGFGASYGEHDQQQSAEDCLDCRVA